MRYENVIGQHDIQQRLRRQLVEGKVAHAYLFAGAVGVGKLPMALAYAAALLCQEPIEGEACERCAACQMMRHWEHPDLHFVFPVAGDKVTSDSYIREWRQLLTDNIYFPPTEWEQRVSQKGSKTIIRVAESDNILQKLSLSSQQGGYKVMIIWEAEKMNAEAANKLLKLLEEPTPKTVFLLVSHQPDLLLETILSRTQRIHFPPLSEAILTAALCQHNALDTAAAQTMARLAEGSYTKALQQIVVGESEERFFHHFVEVMRRSYLRDIKALQTWSETLATWGREQQKSFLLFAQRLVRENFMYNFQCPELVYLSQAEAQFAQRFARFINERNVYGFLNELSEAQRDIEGNGNARMVFFDLALKIAVLIRA